MTWKSTLKSSAGFTLAIFALLSFLLIMLVLFMAWINLRSENPGDLIFIFVSLLGSFLLLGVAGFQFSAMGQHLALSMTITTLCIGSWLACWHLPNISNLLH